MKDERFHGEAVCTAQQLRTPLLLKNLEGRGDLIPIALRRLAAHDREKDTQYCETLYHYLTCCHSLKKTSDALYTHRNTVLYRIRRLQENFAIPLEEPSQHADQEITVLDDHTVSFRLAEPNAAFLEYMTMAILPQHLLEGEDMQESAFFRAPVGTGPYKLESWDAGQSIVLVRNEDYFLGAPNIERVIFKIVPDDNAQAMQLESGEIDLALLDPKNAQNFAGKDGYTCYDMTTADYRGILFNFNNPYWTENRDIIPAVCYAIDRQAIVDSVLLGQGMAAYSPLQRNVYNDETVNHYDYDPAKAKEILESVGCTMGESGYYKRNGEEIGFVISVMSGEQDRIDIAQAAAQQLREVGIHCTVDIPAQMDWSGQMACLIGWGSPFDADDHTYKVFGTDKGANYSGYSNALVDESLTLARQSSDDAVRKEYYSKFLHALADDPAYAFICYIDANYVAKSTVHGINMDTVLGHHGVGIFWNIQDWTIGE